MLRGLSKEKLKLRNVLVGNIILAIPGIILAVVGLPIGTFCFGVGFLLLLGYYDEFKDKLNRKNRIRLWIGSLLFNLIGFLSLLCGALNFIKEGVNQFVVLGMGMYSLWCLYVLIVSYQMLRDAFQPKLANP